MSAGGAPLMLRRLAPVIRRMSPWSMNRFMISEYTASDTVVFWAVLPSRFTLVCATGGKPPLQPPPELFHVPDEPPVQVRTFCAEAAWGASGLNSSAGMAAGIMRRAGEMNFMGNRMVVALRFATRPPLLHLPEKYFRPTR